MRCLLSLLCVVFAATVSAAQPPSTKAQPDPNARAASQAKTPAADKGGQALSVGNNIPPPFHPYYVSGPYLNRLREEEKDTKKVFGRFHCPVSHHGLAPMVLLFVRDVRASPQLKELLRRLDAAVEKNPTSRLGVAVVFVSDEIKDLVMDDEVRENLAGKIEDLAGELKLNHVALCLAGPVDLEKYELNPDMAYTLVLLNRYQIVGVELLPRDKLTTDRIDAILQQVAEKLGTRRR